MNDKDTPTTILRGSDFLSQIRGAATRTEKLALTAPGRFPIESLPPQLQEIILACDEHLKYPPEFTACGFLYAASLAIGNTHKVRVQAAWKERAVLYIACVGRAGTNKTHPLSFALKPITDRDKETYRKYEEEKASYDEIMKMAKDVREKGGMPEPKKPVYRKIIISDITPEATAKVHKDNPRGIGLHADELAGWFKNFNRYSKGSEQEQWLSNWSGQAINIDRKSGEPILITDPFISVLGTIQPAVLDEMAKEGRGQNGFIDRILFAVPQNLTAPKWSNSEIDPIHIENWKNIVCRLLDIQLDFDTWGNIAPRELGFSPEAWDTILQWQHSRSEAVNEGQDDQETSIQAKMQTYAIRLSLVLQMLRYSCNLDNANEIGKEAVLGAIALVGYFQTTAERVHAIVTNTNPLEGLPDNKKRVYHALPPQFKKADGAKISDDNGLPLRNFERFISDPKLFKRLDQGVYQKVA